MVCLAGFGPQALSLTQFECLAPLGSTLFINKHRLRLLQSTALPQLKGLVLNSLPISAEVGFILVMVIPEVSSVLLIMGLWQTK